MKPRLPLSLLKFRMRIDLFDFWHNLDRTHDNFLCWYWKGALDRQGYGRITFWGKTYKAHRFSFRVFCKKKPGKMQVLHKCDNPTCVNPLHLFLGTNADNMRDKVEKGRQFRGVSAPLAKLNDSIVREIKSIWFSGKMSLRELARKYNVSDTTIERAAKGITWRHVT